VDRRVRDDLDHPMTGDRSVLATMPFVLPVACLVAALVFALGDAGTGAAAIPDPEPDLELGAELYATQCANCHGVDYDGVEGRGPSLVVEGTASAHFVLTTGRMPLASPTMQAQRGPVRYSEEEIEALVAFVGSIGDGPDIPDVDISQGDVAEGGELYRLNCAACHVASLAGAPIGAGREAPSLSESTPTQVGEAIVVGPGAMPVFGAFELSDINSIAAYVAALNEENTTGTESFGGAGPVAEGLAAWLLILVPLVALTRWIGTPKSGRDPDDFEDIEDMEHAAAPVPGAPTEGHE
jgi:ubiquinol-cytochrome c reductase cytochrome c subunit